MDVRVHYHVTSVCRTLGLQPNAMARESEKKILSKIVGWLSFWMKVTCVKIFAQYLGNDITPQIEEDINLV